MSCPKSTTYTIIDNVTTGIKYYFRPLIANRQFYVTRESCKIPASTRIISLYSKIAVVRATTKEVIYEIDITIGEFLGICMYV